MKPLKIIEKVTENLNNIKSQKHGYPPQEIKQKTIDNGNFREIYDFIDFLRLNHTLKDIKELIF